MRSESRKRKYDHTGPWESYSMIWEEMLHEIQGYPDDKFINFSEIAQRYNLKNVSGNLPQNGGVVKFLHKLHNFFCTFLLTVFA